MYNLNMQSFVDPELWLYILVSEEQLQHEIEETGPGKRLPVRPSNISSDDRLDAKKKM